jgi:hypothetical protein
LSEIVSANLSGTYKVTNLILIMVEDNFATLTYAQLLKEDLGIFRLVPKEGNVPDFKPGQFLTIGNVLSLSLDGYENHFQVD